MVQFYYILAKLKFLKVYVVNLELFGSTAPLPCVGVINNLKGPVP